MRHCSWRSEVALERIFMISASFASGRSATARRSAGSRSAMMKRSPFASSSFALATTSPSSGRDGLFELEGMADEIAGLVRLFQHQARALDAFVGDWLLGVRERQRLLIFLAEIDEAHVFRGRAAGGLRRGRGRCGLRSRRRRCRRGGRSRRSGRRPGLPEARLAFRPPRAPQGRGENSDTKTKQARRFGLGRELPTDTLDIGESLLLRG